MKHCWLRPVLLAIALMLAPATVSACGPDSDCLVEGGEYRIRLPDDWNGQETVGAIVFLHGYQGSAEKEMSNRALGRMATELGVALITPNGLRGRWSLPQAMGAGRDEITFMNAVIDDVVKDHSIDESRIMASGFSLGGSMVWYLACYMSERFAGFAPIAGGFWEPQPETCPSRSPNLVHVHGIKDRTVPIGGRQLRVGLSQGNVLAGLSMLAEKGQCAGQTPSRTEDLGLTCETRQSCGGATIELCLHPGGHSLRADWIARAWRTLSVRYGRQDQPAAP